MGDTAILLIYPVGHVLLVTRWLTESSAYQSWQSIMVSHTLWEENSVIKSINMPKWIKSKSSWPVYQLRSTAVWDTIMDCQGWYAELSVKYLVTRRPPRSVYWLMLILPDCQTNRPKWIQDQHLMICNVKLIKMGLTKQCSLFSHTLKSKSLLGIFKRK